MEFVKGAESAEDTEFVENIGNPIFPLLSVFSVNSVSNIVSEFCIFANSVPSANFNFVLIHCRNPDPIRR
jgi:hypothetical protein